MDMRPLRHVFLRATCVAAPCCDGLSQEALARDCGINPTFLSGVERSERNVSIDSIDRIAIGLRVSAAQLLEE
jgi:transcriptional regulator with XRE-family HTH domain